MENQKTRVAIIGSGPCGIAAMVAFADAKLKGEEIPEVVCFDKQDKLGGLWQYSWRTGLDQYGEKVHNGQYRYLWSNGPKECLEMSNYSFEEHFKKPIPSYPPREVLMDYQLGRATKYGVEKFVRFETVVTDVNWNQQKQVFNVQSKNLPDQKFTEEEFTHVIVATGHFSTPHVPEFPGFNQFPGRIMHSHDFRDAAEFKGRNVLVIGGSYSAEDIALQCYKYGAKEVVISYRSCAMGFHWPDKMSEKPLLQKVEKGTKTCHFKDESTYEADVIILCTGYKHSFPFIKDDELKLKCNNTLWVNNLYQGVFWTKNPRISYMGMQDQWFTFNMFDSQAWVIRDTILGKLKLPSLEEMVKYDNQMQEKADQVAEKGDWHYDINYQGAYTKSLMELTDYPNFDIKGMCETFFQWEENKHHDILGYRNNCHKSLITGNEQPLHHTKWLEAMDDSLECYLTQKIKK